MRIVIAIDLIVFIPFVLAVGWLTSRILGVHLGFWRAVVAASLGFILGAITAAILAGGSDVDDVVLVPVALFFSVLATMPISIMLELVTRRTKPHHRRSRRVLLHPIRELKAQLAPYGRLRELLKSARHQNLMHVRYASASALESPEFARRLRLLLEDAGGMFVKFGQIASTRTDMLPETLTTELALLRSDVRPIPPDEAREVLESEFGEPFDQTFASFDWEPLAAASIGQTHRAVLHDGTRVVVKIQRPGVDDIVRRDASVLRLTAIQVERRVDAARRIGVRSLAEELISGIEEELDYMREAAAGMRLRENRAGDDGIAIPAVYSTLSTGRVLVMEEVVAVTVGDRAALDAAAEVVPRPELARHLLSSFLGQILQDGQYHADPHPGNVFVDAQGTLWLLDFGSVGRLDPIALEGLQGLALGMSMRDASLVARAVRHLAGDPETVDLRSLETDLGTLMGEVDAGGGIDPQAVREILGVMQRHGLRPPKSISILSRAMLTLEGTLKIISPSFDLATEGAQLVGLDGSSGVGAPQDVLQRELLRSLPALRTLPEHAETIANQLRSGRMTIRTDRYAGGDRHIVEQWIDRVVVAFAGGIGVLGFGVVLLAGSAASDEGVRIALWVIGFAGLAFASVLLMRSVAQVLRRLPLRDE